jgi:hypothetical protein
MKTISDDQLDQLLRGHSSDALVEDDGFTSRVMQALPARPRPRNWLIPTITLGSLVSWLSVLQSSLIRAAILEWQSRAFGTNTALLIVVILSISTLTVLWALEDADENPVST